MWKFVLTALWLGMLAVADIRRMRVPMLLLAVGGVFAAAAVLSGWRTEGQSVMTVLWSMTPGAAMLLVAAVTGKAGWADGAVLLFLGVLEGLRVCMISLLVSLSAISIVSLVLLCFRKAGKNSKLPYLPFLWIGYIIQTVMGSGL